MHDGLLIDSMQVCLPDAVLSIVHVESHVVAALANGKLAVFRRQTDGQWDLNSYHLVTLGQPKQSVRCLCVVADKIWAAHRNKIYIVDPITLNSKYISVVTSSFSQFSWLNLSPTF